MQGKGNRQGELGERLERLAEALSEEGGGASRKVRKLAEEARELEEGMRDGRLTPDEVRRRQERFQSRLLEAANAMEERGMSEERKAEASQGAVKDAPESARAAEARLLQLLREARRNAKTLRLSEAQRRLLDEYYESLLTR
jgi:predicted ATP-dependent endonuclease of OLD family